MDLHNTSTTPGVFFVPVAIRPTCRLQAMHADHVIDRLGANVDVNKNTAVGALEGQGLQEELVVKLPYCYHRSVKRH